MSKSGSPSARLEAELDSVGLSVTAAISVHPSDPVPEWTQTVLLLSPNEPGFWSFARRQPEFEDGAPDPLDRLSKRLISSIAKTCGGVALFPSDGPPFPPFIDWALRSGRIFASQIGFLVSREAGLFVSFRGALAVRDDVSMRATAVSPCASCIEQPCTTACPVDAFASGVFDADACRHHLALPEGEPCLSQGCLARRACPFSAFAKRSPEQSAFHMKAFLK